jgi:type VI secretion system protein ImpD/type VI secretion system protein ImpC
VPKREHAPGPVGLRTAILSGRHTHPDADAVRTRLGEFLSQDRGALASWFGADTVAWIRPAPARLRYLIERDLVQIDALISDQLDTVLHHPALQRLEGSWRGLAWLVEGIEPKQRLKISILPASWRELDRDLARVSEFDQSNLFRMVYENEFGHAGGEPFGLLVIDHEVRHRPGRATPRDLAPVDDLSVMSLLAAIAAAAFVPIVLAASPALLGVDRFEDLVLSNDVAAVMADEEHARWRSATTREDMRFVCLTMPRILARPRWSGFPDHAGGLRHEEQARSTAERCWFVAGYAFAAVVARSHIAHNWPADVRGVSPDRVGGGLVLDLPAEPFVLGASTCWPRPSLSLGLTDTQERALVTAGLMPLNTLPHGEAAFASVHSVQALPPVPRFPAAADANRSTSGQISAMLCVSRFAHYIKMIGRDMTGAHYTAEDVERRLQRWLARYTNANDDTGGDSRARYPLRMGQVKVHDIEGRPGAFACVIHLQPHYQLDDISATFRLVTSFATTSAAA